MRKTGLLLVLAAGAATAQLHGSAIPEPVATKVPHVRDVHGDRFDDVYFWLRKGDKPVIDYLKANNAHADAVTKPLASQREKLYREMVARIKETDLSVPVFDRGFYYYSRTVKGKQYSIYCRRKGSMKAPEQVLLDVNALARGKKFMGVGEFEVSPNGRLLAYSVDENGHRDYRLYFKDLDSGKVLKDRFGIVSGLVWAADSRTVFTTTENAAKRNYRVWRHRLGVPKGTLVYEEKDVMYDVYLGESRDHRYAFTTSASKETSEVRLLDLANPSKPMRLVEKRREGVEYYADHRFGKLVIVTNDGAPEFRIVESPTASPGRAHWKSLLSEQPGATIEGCEVFRNYLVVQIRKDAVSGLRVLEFKTGNAHAVQLPETYYSVGLTDTPDFDAKLLRLGYVSLITPRSVYDYDPQARRLKLLKQQPVNGYDRSKYASELLWATVRDGEKVPIAIAYKKGTQRPAPMLLEAYGAYGAPNDPYFSSTSVSLLDRGMIVGSALVRGGGDMGERWHDAGKMKLKVNTFQDFIDCARHLAQQGVTSPDKLAVTGGSAGGLTIGAALNMAPEIARAALVYVPFVDVVNTMLDESLPLTTQEFIEWGNPKIEEQYRWIRAYSPYDNVAALDYPAMLVRTSLNDSQVPYWEAAKWVARLREMRTDDDPILLKVNLDAGHGGASGRYDSLRDQAYDFAFLLSILNVQQP